MSTIVEQVYTALLTRLQTVLDVDTNRYFHLPNRYNLESNPSRYLLKGYGIALGSGLNTNRQVNCAYSIDRQMTVILTRKYYAKENDSDAKTAEELALFADQDELINDLEQDVSIESQTMYARFQGDGGIEYVQSDKENFIALRSVFSVEYVKQFT